MLLLLACAHHAPERGPDPLQSVLPAAERCHHWMGEEPTDDARAAEIAAGAEKDCGEAKRALAQVHGSLSPEWAAVLDVVLESDMDACARVPTPDDGTTLLDDEARAVCGK